MTAVESAQTDRAYQAGTTGASCAPLNRMAAYIAIDHNRSGTINVGHTVVKDKSRAVRPRLGLF